MKFFGFGAKFRGNLTIWASLGLSAGERGNCLAWRVYSSKSSRDSPSYNKWFTPAEVERMSRRDLQEWCKKLSIRANSKTAQLTADLLDFHRDVLLSSPILKQPFAPMIQFPAKHCSVTTPTSLRPEKGIFVYRGHDVKQQLGVWADISGSITHGVRHYNQTCDQDEICKDCLDDVQCTTHTARRRLPSVSTILRATAPKSRLFAIFHWTKKQKELLGEGGFRAKMKEVTKTGLEFHRFVHQCLIDRSLNTKVPSRLQGYLDSTKEVFSKLGEAIASEKSVSHHNLGYKGKLDTVACYDGDPCIIEWKTSRRKRSSLQDCDDYPMQVVAYAGAVNTDPLFGFQVKRGLVVIAYEDGSPADVHSIDFKLCQNIWQDWLVRVYRFYNKSSCERSVEDQ